MPPGWRPRWPADRPTSRPLVRAGQALPAYTCYGDIADGVCTVGSSRPQPIGLGSARRRSGATGPIRMANRYSSSTKSKMAVLRSAQRRNRTHQSPAHVWIGSPRRWTRRPALHVGAVLLIGDRFRRAIPLLPALQSSLGDRLAEIEAEVRARLPRRRPSEAARGDHPSRHRRGTASSSICPPRSVDESPAGADATGAWRSRRTLLRSPTSSRRCRAMGARNSPRLWIVTRGAAAAGPWFDRVTLRADAATWHRAGADVRASGAEDHAARRRPGRHRARSLP